MDAVLVAALNGLVVGLTLALVASGLALIFGVMGIVNFAHGELYMLGGYLVWLGTLPSGSFMLGLGLAIVGLAVIGTVAFTVAGVARRDRPPLFTALSTLGLGLILREAALRLFGGDAKQVHTPFEASVSVFGIDYPLYRLAIIAIAAALITAIWLYLKHGRYGLWIRAVAQDRAMASALGVKLPVVYGVVFAVSSALAGIGGALLAPVTNVYPSMGLEILLPAFVVVIAGGMGNLRGAAIISVVLGEAEALGSLVMKPTAARTLAFVLLMGWLLIRRRSATS